MRQLERRERGSANWAFIIALILLLVFVYLWWDQKDQKESQYHETVMAKTQADAARQTAQKLLDYATDLSAKVGWQTTNASTLAPEPPGPVQTPQGPQPPAQDVVQEFTKTAQNILGSAVLTDVTQLEAQLKPDGTIDGKPGLLNYMVHQAQTEMAAELRSGSGQGVTETNVKFEEMSPELKQKIAEVNALAKALPAPPTPPLDPDDASAKAQYENDLQAYEKAHADFQAAMDELTKMKGYKEWASVIKGPEPMNPGESTIIKLNFFAQPVTGEVTVADLVTYPPVAFDALKSEFKANKEADAGVIAQLKTESQAKSGTIDQLQGDLAAEQQRHTQDTEGLRNDLAQANLQAENNRQEATKAMQDLTVAKDQAKQTEQQLKTQVHALEERTRIDKEHADLQARLNEPDGTVLSASPTMGTVIIDLGTTDKVYPGLKFDVTANGKGGVLIQKGQVQVLQVLGPHSSKAAILGETSGAPIGQGDTLRNPLFDKNRTLHIYVVGELQRYPREMAVARLAQMHVVVDDQVTGKTNYIVVPDSMAAPKPTQKGEEGGGDEEGPGPGQSEFERWQSIARTFGATIITESMLNRYIEY